MQYCAMSHEVLRPKLYPTTKSFLYEVITSPCVFYMDLDFTYGTNPCFDKCTAAFNWFMSNLNLPPPVYIKDASYSKKFSRHVVAPSLSVATPTDVAAWLCERWGSLLIGRLTEKIAITDKMIDWSVYKVNHLLRLVGNSKRSDPDRPLHIINTRRSPGPPAAHNTPNTPNTPNTTVDPLQTLISLHRSVLETDISLTTSTGWKSLMGFVIMNKRRVRFGFKSLAPASARFGLGPGTLRQGVNFQPINPKSCKTGRAFTIAKDILFNELRNAKATQVLKQYFRTWTPTLTEIRVDKLFIAFNLRTRECPIKTIARHTCNVKNHRSTNGRMVIYNWRNSIHVHVRSPFFSFG